MKRSLYRPYAVVGALLLSACLENVTVGRETQLLSPDDAASPFDDAGPRNDAGLPNRDAGSRDGSMGSIDAGPCVPEDCALQDPAPLEKLTNAECPTGEDKICARDETGTCGLQCPEVPLKRQCYSPVQIQASDGGACPAGQFCRYGLEICGGGIGACTPIPTECNEPEEQVCGCDGVNYPSLCAAFQAGASPRSPGKCP